MKARMAATLWQQRMLSIWLAAFGVLGLTMSIVGLYAVIAQSVTQRTRELSLRLALGASPDRLRRAVVLEGLALAALGAAAGIPLALGALRLADAGESATSAWVFSGIVIVAATIASTYVPARRAARLNPSDALKEA
jgi:ABC-type antimicrobial peptide transport system permease subunit